MLYYLYYLYFTCYIIYIIYILHVILSILYNLHVKLPILYSLHVILSILYIIYVVAEIETGGNKDIESNSDGFKHNTEVETNHHEPGSNKDIDSNSDGFKHNTEVETNHDEPRSNKDIESNSDVFKHNTEVETNHVVSITHIISENINISHANMRSETKSLDKREANTHVVKIGIDILRTPDSISSYVTDISSIDLNKQTISKDNDNNKILREIFERVKGSNSQIRLAEKNMNTNNPDMFGDLQYKYNQSLPFVLYITYNMNFGYLKYGYTTLSFPKGNKR